MQEIEIFHPVSFCSSDSDRKKCEVQNTIDEWGDLLAVFPNNYGINLCAIKGLYVTLRSDNQISQIRIVMIPSESLDEGNGTAKSDRILRIEEGFHGDGYTVDKERLLDNAMIG